MNEVSLSLSALEEMEGKEKEVSAAKLAFTGKDDFADAPSPSSPRGESPANDRDPIAAEAPAHNSFPLPT